MNRPDVDSDIARMTTYCTYCPKMCRFTCPAAHAEGRETVTPWGMMRLFELARDGSVDLDDDVADAFFHCTGCRRCQTFCAHDNDVPRALWEARRWSVANGHLPSAYEALQEQFDEHKTPYEVDPDALDLAPFDAEGTVGFWPDCSTVAHRPHLIAPLGRLISQLTGEKVRLITDDDTPHPPCCGFPLTGAGLDDAAGCRQLWPHLADLDEVWTDCPALAAMERPDSSWPRPDDELDTPPVRHLYGLLAKSLDDLPPPPHPLSAADALLHQSCLVARQIDALDDVDRILALICESPPRKMAYHDDESPCCGGRCHYQILEPDASARAARHVVDSLERHPGAQRLVTTSSMCGKAMGDEAPPHAVTTLLEMVCHAYGLTDESL